MFDAIEHAQPSVELEHAKAGLHLFSRAGELGRMGAPKEAGVELVHLGVLRTQEVTG